uniref:Uncharacterized protein n=1 Tax=Arundo donax TaxID=35708 RepID=A0A0A8Z3Z4_ARUDO
MEIGHYLEIFILGNFSIPLFFKEHFILCTYGHIPGHVLHLIVYYSIQFQSTYLQFICNSSMQEGKNTMRFISLFSYSEGGYADNYQ